MHNIAIGYRLSQDSAFPPPNVFRTLSYSCSKSSPAKKCLPLKVSNSERPGWHVLLQAQAFHSIWGMVHHPLLIIKVLLMDGKPLNILLTSWEGSNTGQICSNIPRRNPHIEHRIEPLNAIIPKESLKQTLFQTIYHIYVQHRTTIT